MQIDLAAAYETYAPALRRYLGRRVPPDDVDDMLHDIFISALVNLSRYEDRGYAVSAWLYAIARSRVVDSSRARRRRKTGSLAAWQATDEGPEDEVCAAEDSRIVVEHLLALLSGNQRRVVELRIVEERTLDEVQAALSLPSRMAVKALQHRALEALRRSINARSFDP